MLVFKNIKNKKEELRVLNEKLFLNEMRFDSIDSKIISMDKEMRYLREEIKALKIALIMTAICTSICLVLCMF